MKDELIKLFLSHIKEYDTRCFYDYFATLVQNNFTLDKPISQMPPTWFAEIMAEHCLKIYQDGASKE